MFLLPLFLTLIIMFLFFPKYLEVRQYDQSYSDNIFYSGSGSNIEEIEETVIGMDQSYTDDTFYSGNGNDDIEEVEETVPGISVSAIILPIAFIVLAIVVGVVYWKVPESRPIICCLLRIFFCRT